MKRLSLTVFGAFALVGAASADPMDVYGVWQTEAGTSYVTIADCGDSTPCGVVTWLDPDTLPEGVTPETATSEAGDKVLGLQMLVGFTARKKDWRGGTIYDPENDKSYASRLKRLDDDRLQVKGCVGPVCQTQVWTVAPEAAG
jgi:uncharacterized protein (DUF2147 family)